MDTGFFFAAMMPLKDGKRGSLIFSVTLTTAGRVASRWKTPSSVSRSPLMVVPSTVSLRSCVTCGRPRYSARIAGTTPQRPSVASLPAMTVRALDGPIALGEHLGGRSVRAVQCLVVDVHRLVGAHGERLADGLGGAAGTDGDHGDLAAVGLLEQQRLLDRTLVDLVEDGVGGLTIQGVSASVSLRSDQVSGTCLTRTTMFPWVRFDLLVVAKQPACGILPAQFGACSVSHRGQYRIV